MSLAAVPLGGGIIGLAAPLPPLPSSVTPSLSPAVAVIGKPQLPPPPPPPPPVIVLLSLTVLLTRLSPFLRTVWSVRDLMYPCGSSRSVVVCQTMSTNDVKTKEEEEKKNRG